jgi:ribosomal protein L24E
MPSTVHTPKRSQADCTDHARAEYIAFLFRAPFALDAYRAGFTVGIREDYDYQQEQYSSLNLPVEMLDNDFRNPDLERFREQVTRHRPQIAVLGDTDDPEEMHHLLGVAADLQTRFSGLRVVVVPKSRRALDVIPRDSDVVVGYSNGYADRTADEFTEPEDWGGRDVHILGGSPPTQWDVIQRLAQTETTLADYGAGVSSSPTNVVGLDWNGLYAVALKGEYWHHESPHWRPADRLSIRETVRQGLAHIRRYWRNRGVWPTDTASESMVIRDSGRPDDRVCAMCGESLHSRQAKGFRTVEDTDGNVYTFCSGTCRKRFGARSQAMPLDFGNPTMNEHHQKRMI